MGVVQRQGFYSLLVSSIGIVVGLLALTFVYILDLEAYGVAQILLAASILIAPFASLGVNVLVTRYFSFFKESAEGRRAFLSTILLVCTVGGGLLAAVYYFIGIPCLRYIDNESNDWDFYARHAWPIICLAITHCYTILLDSYIANLRKVWVTQFLVNLLPKLLQPAIILAYVYWQWDIESLVLSIVGMKLIVLAGLIAYMTYLREFKLTWRLGTVLKSKHTKEMISVAGFSIFGVLGGLLIGRLDTFSLGAYVTKDQVGVYNYAMYAATVVALPYMMLLKITSPQVAEHIAKDDWSAVSVLYKQVARIMSFCGAFVMTGILVSLSELLQLTGKSVAYASVVFAFLFLGLSRMTDLTGSLNGQIMGYSRLYRVSFYFVIGAGLLNLTLNYLFIARLQYGLPGAALATLITLLCFNVSKSLFVYRAFSIHPLSLAVGKNYLILGIVTTAGFYWSPDWSLIVTIAVKSILVTLAYFSYLWFSEDQTEIRDAIKHQLKRLA